MICRTALFLLPAALGAATAPGYVGMAACGKCHSEIHNQWTHSRHSKMVQPATKESVQGDFKLPRVKLRGAFYGLRERDGIFYITELRMRCVRDAIPPSARRLRRTRTTLRAAPAAPASNATCRAPYTASRPKFATIR
jgi:hypothetical protein